MTGFRPSRGLSATLQQILRRCLRLGWLHPRPGLGPHFTDSKFRLTHPSSAIGPSLSLKRLSVLLYRSVRLSGNNLECLPDHVTQNRVRLGEEAS